MSVMKKIKQQWKSRTVRRNTYLILGAIAEHVVMNPAILVAPSLASLIVAGAAVYNIYLRNITVEPISDK